MTERNEDENQPLEPDDGLKSGGSERDLRSVMGKGSPTPGRQSRIRPEDDPGVQDQQGTQSPVSNSDAAVTQEEEVPPPYVPPIREGDEYERRRRLETPPDQPPQQSEPVEELGDQKLPPVWPGDEKQPWFRRERGLPPLPDTKKGEGEKLDPEEFPTALADVPTRGRAFGLNVVLPNIVGILPLQLFGLFFGLVFFVVNLFLYRQGQDIGALAFKLRVVRENGDVAGFFTMFVRAQASIISLILLGAGFWGAFSDPARRTWHDKWLGTYVVKDSPEYNTRKRSSSETAYTWFWIIILLFIAAVLLIVLSGPVAPEATPPAE